MHSLITASTDFLKVGSNRDIKANFVQFYMKIINLHCAQKSRFLVNLKGFTKLVESGLLGSEIRLCTF